MSESEFELDMDGQHSNNHGFEGNDYDYCHSLPYQMFDQQLLSQDTILPTNLRSVFWLVLFFQS